MKTGGVLLARSDYYLLAKKKSQYFLFFIASVLVELTLAIAKTRKRSHEMFQDFSPKRLDRNVSVDVLGISNKKRYHEVFRVSGCYV